MNRRAQLRSKQKRFETAKIEVEITFGREARLRLWLAAKLFQLAGFVYGGSGSLKVNLDERGNPATL